jgi:S-adenosylmethionine synthetase
MIYFKSIVAGGMAVCAVTVTYAIVEVNKVSAIVRATGLQALSDLDLSFLVRDPQYLAIATASFIIAFYCIYQSSWPK